MNADVTQSELSQGNYKRITIINCLLTVPLIVLFAYPYLYLAHLLSIQENIIYIGCFLFALPFTLTIMHGHVTMALGAAHRHHYYQWMEERPLTYGLLFHPVMTSTRFRLILVLLSLVLIPGGWLFKG